MAQGIQVNVGEHIPGFVQLMSREQSRKAFPKVLETLNKVTEMYQELWIHYAKHSVPGYNIIKSGAEYSRSIKINTSNETEKIIYSDNPKLHRQVENSHGTIDLKDGLLKGPKARHRSWGSYNIVAFTHRTPSKTATGSNVMPVQIYNIVKKFEQSKEQAKWTDASGIQRTHYEFKERLGSVGKQETKETPKGKYTWKTGKYSGMVRMQQNTEGAKHSGYITFRCVSSRSDPASWIVPAKQGVPIRKAVVDIMTPIVNKAIAEAFEIDIGTAKGKE
jgi:hypothetical protein